MTDDLHTGPLHDMPLHDMPLHDMPLLVERDIVLEQPADEVWRLLATAEGWQEWLVDAAAVEVAPGHGGTVLDGGVVRHVDVDEVRPGRSLTFRWWEPDDPGAASLVSIHLDDVPGGGSRLRIAEQAVAANTSAPTARAASARWSVWEVRACLLALALRSPVRV